jgi:hypothetical protein
MFWLGNHVELFVINNVAEEHAASIFRAKLREMMCGNVYVSKLLVVQCLFPCQYSFLTSLGSISLWTKSSYDEIKANLTQLFCHSVIIQYFFWFWNQLSGAVVLVPSSNPHKSLYLWWNSVKFTDQTNCHHPEDSCEHWVYFWQAYNSKKTFVSIELKIWLMP